MNEKELQELKYDLDRETDFKKAHALIEKYMYWELAVNQKTEKIPNIDKKISDLQRMCNVQCSKGNWDFDSYGHGLANGLIFAHSIMADIEPKFLDAPKKFITDKTIDEEVCQDNEIEETSEKIIDEEACQELTSFLSKKFEETSEKQRFEEKGSVMVIKAAQALFDNRCGWSDSRNPYATRKFWADLGAALYGENDDRVEELRNSSSAESKDVDYFSKKMMADLGIPKEYTGDDFFVVECHCGPEENCSKCSNNSQIFRDEGLDKHSEKREPYNKILAKWVATQEEKIEKIKLRGNNNG